jgi:hypothetical protein
MPFEIRWDNDEESILLMRVTGEWSLGDYYMRYLEGKIMMEAVEYPVFLILDMTDSARIPSRMMSTASFSKKNRAKNLEFTVFVGASLFVRTLAEVLSGIISSGHKKRLYFANNLEGARQIINSHINDIIF